MIFRLQHQVPGRLRLRLPRYSLDLSQAVALELALESWDGVYQVRVNTESSSLLIFCDPGREASLLLQLRSYQLNSLETPSASLPRLTNRRLRRDLVKDLTLRTIKRSLIRMLPFARLKQLATIYRSLPYLKEGLASLRQLRFDLSLLDASAIAISLLMGQAGEAANIMYLLGISSALEEYTVAKARNSLAESLLIDVDRVWQVLDGEELVEVPASSIQAGDRVRILSGSQIPFDAKVIAGEAMVNQASLTGEAEPVFKNPGSTVMAGTTLTEGELEIEVRKALGESRIQQIAALLDQAESNKAALQSKAEALADGLVPWSFGFAGLVYLLTGNWRRVAAVMMVDFSCAMKLAIPMTVISAMQTASQRHISVRGGNRLENFALADTLVFDKTGTLTGSEPKLMKILPLEGFSREEVLHYAACLEEHFPHSLARAIVRAAEREGLKHPEDHSEVRYIVAHGIVTDYRGDDARIGSYHFLFEDSGIPLSEETKSLIEEETAGYSTLYLALRGKLIGILCVEEPLRNEAPVVIEKLRSQGLKHLVLMTGDGPQAARRVAEELSLDDYYASCLPETKVEHIRKLQAEGRHVIMVGDGVNDSPALAQADVSVAMRDASDLAHDSADISLLSQDLYGLLELRHLSLAMQKRAERSQRFILGFNGLLLLAGAFSLLPASTLALFHNTSTLLICSSNLLPYKAWKEEK